jgi:hypothetical protein
MRRGMLGIAHACGLMLALWLLSAAAACSGSEVALTAPGGVGSLPVSWHLIRPCDVAGPGLLLGRHLAALTRVAAPIQRADAIYSSTATVAETDVYWVAAGVVHAVEGISSHMLV